MSKARGVIGETGVYTITFPALLSTYLVTKMSKGTKKANLGAFSYTQKCAIVFT